MLNAPIDHRSGCPAVSEVEGQRSEEELPGARTRETRFTRAFKHFWVLDEQDRIVCVLIVTKGRVGGPNGVAARLVL